MELNNENLKVMSARCVVALKGGTPLSTSISDVAIEYGLTKDQICRLIESSNQLAYLSELESSPDRTFEFEVATYEDVLANIMPSTGIDKCASKTHTDPLDLVSGSFASMEKVASAEKTIIQSMSREEVLRTLTKVASHERNRLDELKSTEYDSLVKIAQYREKIQRDPEALLKMAQFDNGKSMSKIVFGHTKVAEDSHRLWSDSDMSVIKGLSETLTLCKSASEEKKSLESKVLEAENMIKQAFIAASINAARNMAPKVKSGIENSKNPVVNKAKKGYKAFDAVDTSNEIRKNTKTNQVWAGLRG